MKKFLNWIKSPSSDFILFILLLVLINIAGYNSFARIDLTKTKSYSLSKGSKVLVKNLESPLSVRVFFDENLPSPYSSTALYVKDLLSEYKGAANKNFSLINVDLSKKDNVQLAMDYGLNKIQIQEIKNNEVGFKQVYMGLVLTYGDSVEVIDGITNSDGFEYKFTSTITKMIGTLDALSSLKEEEKIDVTLYVSESLKLFGIQGTDDLESIVEKSIEDANKMNMNCLNYKVVHPLSDEVPALIEKYGIQGIQFKDSNGTIQNAALGLIIEQNDKFRILPVNVQKSIFNYEISGLDYLSESITQNLQSLVSKVTNIGYVTGHGEWSLQNEEESKNFNTIVSQNYHLDELDLATQEIPATMNSLIINGPKSDFTEAELYKIDQFVMKGGNLILFMDGLQEQSYYQNQSIFVENSSTLDTLLNKYGVKREANIVMDKNCYVNNSSQFGSLNLYWAPIIQNNQFAKKNPITSNLGYVVMVQNGSINVEQALADKDIKTTIIAKSSNESWTQSENIMLNPLTIQPPTDGLKAENLAVLLEGKFASAFDKSVSAESTDDSSFVAENHIEKSIMPGKIFVSGSSYITTYQVLDETGSSPTAMFLLNILDYCNGNEDLCSMRTKGLSVNNMTIKSPSLALIFRSFNQFGLAIIVAIIGLFVWRERNKHKKEIRSRYNPNDDRTITKKTREEKNEN